MTDFQAVQLRAFREEARELLTELETALLALERTPDDRELVARVFRAMHTIKGSSAMCGFDDIADLTHHAEGLLDQARSGQIEPTRDLIDLALAVTDQVRMMVESKEGGRPPDPATTAMLVEWMGNLGAGPGDPPAEAPPVAQAPEPPKGPLRCLRVRVVPHPDLWRSAARISLVLDELRTLGKLVVRADTSRIPPLEEMDPTQCYLSWDVMLLTRAEEAAVRDALLFIEASSTVSIEEYDPHAADPLAGDGTRRESPAAAHAGLSAPDTETSLVPRAAAGDPAGPSRAADLLVATRGRLLAVAAKHPDAAADLTPLARELERLANRLRPADTPGAPPPLQVQPAVHPHKLGS